MTQYNYRQLHGIQSIRLLHVNPGQPSEPIHCCLVHTSLLQRPTYEAVSYTWGPIECLAKIYCDGKEVSVRRNLFALLSRFRKVDAVRVMWIDALCINQNDYVEKSRQIPLMGEIYRQASGGLIWLGEQDHNHKSAMETLQLLHNFITWYTTNVAAHPQGRSLSLQEPEVQRRLHAMKISPEKWHSLNRLFQRSWFTRVWVIQEAIFMSNAQSPTIIACGDEELSWGLLADTAQGIVSLKLHFLYGHGDLQDLGYSNVCLMNRLRRDQHNPPRRNLLSLLHETRSAQASDPKDKIFGLFGLLEQNDRNNPLLLPDYTKDAQTVFKNAAIQIMQSTKSLHLLSYLPWTLPQNGANTSNINLPSWVPDWSIRHTVPPLPWTVFRAGGREHPIYRICEAQDVLIVHGKIVDHIETIMDADLAILQRGPDRTENPMSEVMKRLHYNQKCYQYYLHACSGLTGRYMNEEFPIPSADERYRSGEPLLDAFWRTLICNLDMQRRRPGPEYRSYWLNSLQLYIQPERSIVEHSLSITSEQWPKILAFEEPQAFYAGGRRFCTTSDGYMGWAPQKARKGDLVCIFKGVEVPFVIRKAYFVHGCLPFMIAPGIKYYNVVGECYIHGIMEGQLSEVEEGWSGICLR